MASAQEKTTPTATACCIDTSKSSSAAADALQDWTITASAASSAAPSEEPIRNTAPSMAAQLIRPLDSLPDQPTKTSSTKGKGSKKVRARETCIIVLPILIFHYIY